MPRLLELEYSADSTARFCALRDRAWPVFLDSGHGGNHAGRYDILAADPYVTLTTRAATTEIRAHGQSAISRRDPLELVAEALGDRAEPIADLPFSGGAIGYFAYDLGRRYERLPALAARDIDVPELAIGIYDWAVVVDHAEQRAWLVAQGRDLESERDWQRLVESVTARPTKPRQAFRVSSPVRSSFDRAAYARAFARVQDNIRDGDCYQINLTQRFEARVQGDAWQAYERLRRINPAPYSAYLEFPFGQVLCSSRSDS